MSIGTVETVADRMANFVVSLNQATIPAEVMEKARCCLLYGLGVGLCSFSTPFAAVSGRAAEALHPPAQQGATIFWSGRRAPVTAAVLANAALLHGRCQEDTSGTAHLGVMVIPLLLALLETRAIPADRLLPALVAGYEVGGHLEATLARLTVKAGFRASPIYGVFAATAAACRLLDAPAPVVRSALAHAAAFAGGTLQALGEGSDEWRYQVGLAAEAGLMATELARAGAEGARLAFEGRQGFARVFTRDELPAALCERLGADWTILRTTFKPFPVCAHNQSVATAALHLRERVDVGQVASVEVRIDPYVVPGMLNVGPFGRVSETLMSTAFCAAAALTRGRLDMAELQAFDDPVILDLTARTEVVTTPDVVFPACTLRARLRGGEVVEQVEALTSQDYDLKRVQILDQLHRMAVQNDVDGRAVDMLAVCVEGLPDTDPLEMVRAFSLAHR
ncbi:MAG: MmgE/PrpD family protein [Janthinobacterium lividum]